MKLIINGQEERVDLGVATLEALLDRRRPIPPFAVELNKQLIKRPDFARTPLAEGDRVEIVTLVGGG